MFTLLFFVKKQCPSIKDFIKQLGDLLTQNCLKYSLCINCKLITFFYYPNFLFSNGRNMLFSDDDYIRRVGLVY